MTFKFDYRFLSEFCEVVWGRGVSDQLPTFDAESQSAQIPKSHYGGGEGESLGPNFDAESKSGKNPNFICGGGQDQLLMLSPNLAKT